MGVAGLHDRVTDLVSDPHPCRAGTEHDHPVVGQRPARDPDTGQDRRERDRSGALHVVVERADLVAVAVQDAASVGLPEVLPMQQRLREHLLGSAHIPVDERVVLLPAQPGVLLAEIPRVREQSGPIGPHIQHDWDRPFRIHPGRCDVDADLADRDVDTADPPVPDAEDRFGVGGHDEVHVVGPELQVREGLGHVLWPAGLQIHPAGAAERMAVLPDRLADRRRVDDRHEFGQVLDQQPVEQRLVAVVQFAQVHVLGQDAGLFGQLAAYPQQLLVDGLHPLRQQTHQSQFLTLGVGECRLFVEPRVGQQCLAT